MKQFPGYCLYRQMCPPVKHTPEARSKCAPGAVHSGREAGVDAVEVEQKTNFSRRTLVQVGLLGSMLNFGAKASRAKEAEPDVPQISSQELLEMSKRIEAMPPTYRNASSTPRLFDVRSPQEYAKYHVKNTINVPYLPPEGFEERWRVIEELLISGGWKARCHRIGCYRIGWILRQLDEN
ncbi:hypothetical protein DUNSADRAFT_366 [Dunaliella salina]|uniref:Rhodanese domain-containing protein n=1 Tax=Dunaliella salina TaxID=3046 RepID=A0ABQ7FZ19_DUNSA|nr:hypothetical protein DUNSADRAFT_366 [Dunaliella salina]|eukprot:KAF5827599.1 hypothetical protein DUNSADRAFT_366 [Dunaliella salina]